jgi:hypothetical protein
LDSTSKEKSFSPGRLGDETFPRADGDSLFGNNGIMDFAVFQIEIFFIASVAVQSAKHFSCFIETIFLDEPSRRLLKKPDTSY